MSIKLALKQKKKKSRTWWRRRHYFDSRRDRTHKWTNRPKWFYMDSVRGEQKSCPLMPNQLEKCNCKTDSNPSIDSFFFFALAVRLEWCELTRPFESPQEALKAFSLPALSHCRSNYAILPFHLASESTLSHLPRPDDRMLMRSFGAISEVCPNGIVFLEACWQLVRAVSCAGPVVPVWFKSRAAFSNLYDFLPLWFKKKKKKRCLE